MDGGIRQSLQQQPRLFDPGFYIELFRHTVHPRSIPSLDNCAFYRAIKHKHHQLSCLYSCIISKPMKSSSVLKWLGRNLCRTSMNTTLLLLIWKTSGLTVYPGRRHCDSQRTYLGHKSSQLLPEQRINCRTFPSTSSGRYENISRGVGAHSWNT